MPVEKGERIAKALRDQQLEADAKRNRIAEQRAHWAALSDDDMVAQYNDVEKTLKDYEELVGILREDVRIARTVLVSRGLWAPVAGAKREARVQVTHGDSHS